MVVAKEVGGELRRGRSERWSVLRALAMMPQMYITSDPR